MNRETFMKKLSEVGKTLGAKWELDPADQVRLRVDHPKLGDVCFCPITAVCYAETGCYWGTGKVDYARRKLHMESTLSLLIVSAADMPYPVEISTIREELLTAARLPLKFEEDD